MIDDWAIVVGIQPYAHEIMNTLSGPEKDAQAFDRWLRNEKGGNVPEPHIKFFTPAKYAAPQDPWYARPNTSDIRACVDEIIESLQEKRGRRLYIYMAGHGCTTTQNVEVAENVALFMANAQFSPLRHAMHNFPGTSCANYMRYGGYFNEVVLIMDCCRLKYNAASLQQFPLEENTVRSGRLILAYVTGWDAAAKEWPFPPDNEKRGIFTHELLEVLNSGRITAAQFRESVKEHVRRFCKADPELRNNSNSQEPEILGNPDLEAIVFSENADPPRSLITIKRQPGMSPPEVLYGGWPPKPVLREPGDPEDKWQWLLTPGKYGLRVDGKDIKEPFTVFAALPEEVEVVF